MVMVDGHYKKENQEIMVINSGLKAIEKIVDYSIKKKISYLTLFTFSSENWKRPKKEINFLFKLLENYFKKNLPKVIKNGIKVKIIGNKSKFAINLKK
jgi:undecaprenyl diphosphate synthase